ncbi:unnamed protein product [Caenorhabditis brenneri]
MAEFSHGARKLESTSTALPSGNNANATTAQLEQVKLESTSTTLPSGNNANATTAQFEQVKLESTSTTLPSGNNANATTAQFEQVKLESTSTTLPSGNNANADIEESKDIVVTEAAQPSENCSSNNEPAQNDRTQDANCPRVDPKPEAQAALGNNSNDEQHDDDDESTDSHIGIPMDPPESSPEEKAERQARDAENRTRTDANNPEDVSTLRPPEASFYPDIRSEKPIKNPILKCSQVRWFYKDPIENKMIPFNGQDSLIVEIVTRLSNGVELDDYAMEEVYEKHMKDWNLPESEDAVRNKKVFLLNGYYYLSEDNTELVSEYWPNEKLKIERHTYFEEGDKLLDKKLQQDIRVFLRTKKAKKDIEIEFHSDHELKVTKRGEQPKIVTFYSKPAKWEDQYSEIKHLVFVVHGVGHRDNENAVVEAAQRLINGVESLGTSSGNFFIPIHWRKWVQEGGHKCDESCSQEQDNFLINSAFDDVRLYNCTVTGKKIREEVKRLMNEKYQQFITNNQGFEGTVGIFGHSLGSVISYDILTNFDGVTLWKQDTAGMKLDFSDKVKHLLTVGSPLKRFIYRREERHIELKNDSAISHQMEMKESPLEQFRLVHSSSSFRISNIYHQTDFVANYLEPLIDEGLRYRIDYLVSNNFQHWLHMCYPYLDGVYKLVRSFFEGVEVPADASEDLSFYNLFLSVVSNFFSLITKTIYS